MDQEDGGDAAEVFRQYVGDAFGKYELLERIAVGGMAEIFRARSAMLGGVTRTCVIKRILPEYSCDRQFVSMFIDEARITIGLDHTNIVRLFDFGQVDGTYFMAMEFVDGADLVDILRLHKRLGKSMPAAAAAYVAKCMCEGLHHAHVQKDHRGLPLGIVHRDVSPHNIFVSWDGEVKVGDFGIASARNKITVTEAGTVKGKFAYMAPEQTTGNHIDARADVWAVGVVLHELLSSMRLFATDNPVQTIGRVNTMEIPPPSEKAPMLGTGLDAIVMRALDRDLKQRYPSARAMAEDLNAWIGGEGGDYDQAAFAAYLTDLDWSDDTAPVRRTENRDDDRTPSVEIQVSHLERDPEIDRLLESLQREPNLWTLVEIGAHSLKIGDNKGGLSAIRTAAAVFAHRGMLVQMICAYDVTRACLDDAQREKDLAALVVLRNNDRADLEAYLAREDHANYWRLLKAVDRKGLGGEGEDTNVLHPAPLFGRLPPAEFARLAMAATVRTVDVGSRVLTEGETSNSLFAVGRGRLVVHCLPGETEPLLGDAPPPQASASDKVEPIYLSALADGDFFGEFSFLTGRPRSATVESITPCTILELDQTSSESVLHADPAYNEPLLDFYKERVGELMMAKNPIFALLSSEDRRELLMRSHLRRFDDQELVIRQGEISEDMYFIKHGEVEVFRDDGGVPVFINKLREGQFFGEMAALHGTARTASVRAMGEVELVCMVRSELDDILSRELEVKRMFEAAIAWRAAETSARMAESRRIFAGT